MQESRRSDYVLIAVACLVLYLAGNGRVSLWDRDEAWYAQTAREMLERGDAVLPTFNDEPRLRKPVLIYWLMGGALALFGDNEFGARFVSAVAGTLTCLLTYRLGCRMMGRTVGLVAAAILAVAPFMVIESKLATTDATLAALLTAAFCCLWELKQAPSWRYAVAFWLLVAVSILLKGPFGLAFLGLGWLPWLVLGRHWTLLGRLNWLAGLGLVIAVCLPWGIAIHRATGGEFYRVALGEQALGHSLRAMNGHAGFPGFYVLILLGGFLPWSLAIGLGLAEVRRWLREGTELSFLLVWAVGPLVLLELMRTKLPQYYLPAFPAWSLLIARGLVQLHASGALRQQPAGRRLVIALGAIGTLLVAGAIAAAIAAGGAGYGVPLVAIAAVTALGTVASLIWFGRARDRLGWAATVATYWSASLIAAAWLLPAAEPLRLTRASADALRAAADQTDPVVLFGFREPSLVYYLGRPVPSLGSVRELTAFLHQNGSALTVLRPSDMKRLAKHGEIAVHECRRLDRPPLYKIGSRSTFVTRLRLAKHPDPYAASRTGAFSSVTAAASDAGSRRRDR